MYNQDTLREFVVRRLHGRRFVVVSNREPFIHVAEREGTTCIRPASGVTTALDPVLRATHGLWVAHGSGSADREVCDVHSRIAVPPEEPQYTLKRVWLSREQEDAYYYGLANQALWPLCHIAYQSPVFEEAHWKAYQSVNRLFADAVAEEVGDQPAFVFIQDYHFALLSGMIKERCPKVITAQFWHIPWPNSEVLRILPWKEAILEGLLNNDMLGFHLRYHCLNFLDAVSKFLEARVDMERFLVAYQGVNTKVRAFPISVDFEAIEQAASAPEVETEMERLRERFQLKADLLAVGVDRLDYTKGIVERFRAVDRFLRSNPQYRGRFTLFQAGVSTRSLIPRYQEAESEMVCLAEEINRAHQVEGWQPILFVREHLSPLSLHALYRLANLCMVSSLHDGMNLVAKEFVSARVDEGGVLLLSRFAGAAREMDSALFVNPFATDEFSEAIQAALEMDPAEARWRMRRMRETVARNNIYRWVTDIVEKISNLEEEQRPDDIPLEPMALDRASA